MTNRRRIPFRYRLLRRLPTYVRHFLVYIGSPKMTVGASAVIWDSEGQVLLVRHTYRRPAWGFPSGLVARGEDPSTALRRELREELGVQAIPVALLHVETHTAARHLTLYYQMNVPGSPRSNGVEVDAFRYADLDELATMAGAPPAEWLWAARDQRQSRSLLGMLDVP